MKISFLYGASLGTMIRLLMRHKAKISFRHLPSLIMHFFFGVFNSILMIPDVFWKDKGKPKNIVFIVGHFRCGTTHLLNLMSVDGKLTPPTTYQSAFPNSFLTTEKLFSPLFNKFTPEVRPMDNVAMRMESPQEEEIGLATLGAPTPYLAVHFPETGEDYQTCVSFKNASLKDRTNWERKHKWYVKKLVKKHGPEVTLLFKSPANTARIPLLMKMYPEAKFVHIHREPYRTIRSSIHLYEKWYEMDSFQSLDTLNAKLYDSVFDVYEEINRAWIEDAALIPPENVIRISFKDLQAAPMDILQDIYRQFNLGELDELKVSNYLKDIKSYKKNEYDPLSKDLVARIDNQLGFVFEEFGYEKRT